MPRKKVDLTYTGPISLSARCINKEWFQIPIEQVWLIMEDYLFLVQLLFGLKIHAFVLMNNHWHLLASAPLGNMSEIMKYFMRETSKRITEKANRINQTWGNRVYKCLIKENLYFFNSYKYIYRNPVKAGLCERVEDYQYSTLAGLLGIRRMAIPMPEDTILFEDVEGVIKWLNIPPSEEDWNTMRKALRRNEFRLPKDRSSRKPHRLESELL